MSSTSQRLATMSLSALLTLLAVEGGLRSFGWAEVVEFSAHPRFEFLMTPSQEVFTYGHPVIINSLGLRGPELQEPKPSATTRILFVGDSITYGGGRIKEERLFCRIVESLARRDHRLVEIVNLSAPAWSPQNWIEYIEDRGMHEADIVVLVLPECDLDRPLATLQWGGHRTNTLSSLRLVNVAEKARRILSSSPPFAEQLTGAERVVANTRAVHRLRELVGKRPFFTVLIPTPASESELYWPPFEDLLPQALDLREPMQDQPFFLDGVHLNVAGHQFVGERLYEELEERFGLAGR